MQEGTFFGDIFDTGSLSNIGKPNAAGPLAYYCDGAGYPAGAAGVVAGRLGASQANAPYTNPYTASPLCQNALQQDGYFTGGVTGSCGSMPNAPSTGCPDGYKQLSLGYGANGGTTYPWKNAITVWRNNNYTPVFDTGYQYTISPAANTGYGIDTGTSPVQLYDHTANYASSFYVMSPVGSNWTFSPINNSGKCLDAGPAGNGGPVNLTRLQQRNVAAVLRSPLTRRPATSSSRPSTRGAA